MAPDDSTILENLKYLVERAEKALREIEGKHQKAQEQLTHARALLEFERERSGTPATNGRFSELSLREATLKVIQEGAGEELQAVTIWDTLRRNGYPLPPKNPGRAIHAALIGAEQVERVAKGKYRWRNGHSPMPVGNADLGNAQQG